MPTSGVTVWAIRPATPKVTRMDKRQAMPKAITRDRPKVMAMVWQPVRKPAILRDTTKGSRMLTNHTRPVSRQESKSATIKDITRNGIMAGSMVGATVGGWAAPLAGSAAVH